VTHETLLSISLKYLLRSLFSRAFASRRPKGSRVSEPRKDTDYFELFVTVVVVAALLPVRWAAPAARSQRRPDAETTSDRSLFLADLANIEWHRTSIRHYRFRTAAAADNVKEPVNV
jgi:hypothetical protein